MRGKFWTEDKIKSLTELWDGCKHSASQIAVLLGPEFNRNMVIGKAKRLKLKKKGRVHYAAYGIVARKLDRPRKRRQSITAVVGGAMNRRAIQRITLPSSVSIVPAAKAPSIELAPSEDMGFWQAGADQCRYPLKGLNEVDSIFDYRCCGRPITQGPYCAIHAALCYRPANWR
jgi:hypothetical protein